MRRFLRIWRAIFSPAIQTLVEYREDALLMVVGACLVQLSALAFLWVVIHQAGTINGWQASQVLLLMGLTGMTQGLSEQFFDNVWRIPSYILEGDLDRLLVYPVRPLPFLLIALPQLHAIGNFGTGLAFTVASLVMTHASPLVWALVPLWVACGCVIYTSILVIMACLAFTAVGTSDYLFVVYHFLHANRYPLSAYPRWVRMAFLVVLPFGTCIFVPASWVAGHLTGIWWAFLPVPAAAVFALLALFAWSRGIRKYQSVGA